jgi:hypothetical protein
LPGVGLLGPEKNAAIVTGADTPGGRSSVIAANDRRSSSPGADQRDRRVATSMSCV